MIPLSRYSLSGLECNVSERPLFFLSAASTRSPQLHLTTNEVMVQRAGAALARLVQELLNSLLVLLR